MKTAKFKIGQEVNYAGDKGKVVKNEWCSEYSQFIYVVAYKTTNAFGDAISCTARGVEERFLKSI